MSIEARQQWFSELVEAGLAEEIFGPSDVLEQATPEVLASCLPPDLMAKVLQSALSAGKMTPERVLETLTPALCAEHIPHEVLWSCTTGAAKRSGISEGNGGTAASDKRRVFLRRALEVGLEHAIVTPDDVLEFATPEVIATHLPTELKAKLIEAALRADAMNPALIVDTVGVEDLAKNLPTSVVWSALAKAGDRAVGEETGITDAKTDAKSDNKSDVIGAVSAATKSTRNRRPSAAKPTKGAQLAAGSAPKRRSTLGKSGSGYDADDTNVNAEWADADEFEVVDEADVVGAEPDAILKGGALPGADWTDEETNVGADSTTRGK